eukprot:CAMPEP_0172443480 /NCGR_PEP_ID=MMETSP1065-20121228/3738_1 /TAXON_ID=265537 /ORGANISM="Amphiprora paludosa, Strain CCMP125" /LENGTH=542 /DNA_ID=CAMNT_0013193735 /DNA_START=52 /DNA_END=1680 /DNA_ORIENTATION=-
MALAARPSVAPVTLTTSQQHPQGPSRLFMTPNPEQRTFHSSSINAFSDRLLGHSPMSPGGRAPESGTMSAIPTAQDVTTSGGVWAPTSAKRDKIAELHGALEENQRTLDDAAAPYEKHDLWLCDGVSAVAGTVDSNSLLSSKKDGDSESVATNESNSEWKERAEKIFTDLDSWWESKVPADAQKGLALIQFENMLQWYRKELEQHLEAFPPAEHLRDVRDFFDVNTLNSRNPKYVLPIPESEEALTDSETSDHFHSAVLWYRLSLAHAAAQTLQSSWQTLTAVSDQDVDRAAVNGQTSESLKVSTLPPEKVYAVLQAFLKGSASDRVDAIWDLMDRDQDGLLDETEMVKVSDLAIAPVRVALEQLLTEAVNASQVRPKELDATNYAPDAPPESIPKLSWRQRRKEAKEQKKLLRTFQKMLKRHFSEEVEEPHRLRCIYAWANKMHQNNKIESVLVENVEALSGFGGRKRYVELKPKISLAEFREVQQEHFTHLDRVGAEFMKSFREDLWVIQGKGRERSELYRDSAIFMTVVCLVDYAIVVM